LTLTLLLLTAALFSLLTLPLLLLLSALFGFTLLALSLLLLTAALFSLLTLPLLLLLSALFGFTLLPLLFLLSALFGFALLTLTLLLLTALFGSVIRSGRFRRGGGRRSFTGSAGHRTSFRRPDLRSMGGVKTAKFHFEYDLPLFFLIMHQPIPAHGPEYRKDMDQ